MGSIGDWGAGATPAKGNSNYYGDSILWLRTGELNNGVVYDTEIKITERALKECSLRVNKVGDVLIAMYGATIGKVAIVGKELTTNQACCACTPFGVLNYYLFYYLMGSQMDFIKKGEGGAQPNISREKLILHLMPIPPLNEQHRIVENIRNLLPLIEKYSNSQSLQDKLNAEINEKLRKSILQEAIQGKIVPQMESEGTTEELLEQIKQEKQRLVKEGKLNKSALQDSVIFRGDDNKYYERIGKNITDITAKIPFEIPQNWQWTRLGDVVMINPRNSIDDKVEVGFIPMASIEAGYKSIFSYTYRKWRDVKSGFTHLADDDVALAKIAPCFQNRKSMILNNLPNGYAVGTTELNVLRSYNKTIIPEYLLWFCKSTYFVEAAIMKGTAGQQRVKVDYTPSKLFPLPPMEEQKRIAVRIRQLLKILK